MYLYVFAAGPNKHDRFTRVSYLTEILTFRRSAFASEVWRYGLGFDVDEEDGEDNTL